MTLLVSLEQQVGFTGSSADGIHTGANTAVSASRLQVITAWAWSDVDIPDWPVLTNSYSSFDWTEITESRMYLVSTLHAYSFTGTGNERTPRHIVANMWYGFAATGSTGATTADFGTFGASGLAVGDAGSGWQHYEIRGFATDPTDNGLSVIPQWVYDEDSDNNVTFGGFPAGRSELPDPLYNAESLIGSVSLVEHARNNPSAYTADGTKDVVQLTGGFPAAGFQFLRNSTDTYTTSLDDLHPTDSSLDDFDSAWTQFAFEVTETPVEEEVESGYWGILMEASA